MKQQHQTIKCMHMTWTQRKWKGGWRLIKARRPLPGQTVLIFTNIFSFLHFLQRVLVYNKNPYIRNPVNFNKTEIGWSYLEENRDFQWKPVKESTIPPVRTGVQICNSTLEDSAKSAMIGVTTKQEIKMLLHQFSTKHRIDTNMP